MKTKHKSIQFIFLLASIFSGLLFASPELIVINADIRTADPIRMRASAFAIEAGKFTAVGTNEEILKLVEPNTSCLLYTSPSPRDRSLPRMPSSA